MSQKKPDSSQAAGELKHNPFVGLAKDSKLMGKLGSQLPTGVVSRQKPNKPPPPLTVRLRLESVGRSGKVVTRITGLPAANVEAIAQRLRKALGCGAVVEGDDVLLQGSLRERANEWLERAGDLRDINVEKSRVAAREASLAGVQTTEGLSPSQSDLRSGTSRSHVRRGRRVAIVLKADQDTGKLTQGIVRDVLTNSEIHPRGIKVRLESGEVGRVKIILE
jgi:uncharacterized repeat protein (TIGR03833 family)